MLIKFFGTSGSCAVRTPSRDRYSTNSSCVLVRIGGQAVVLDLGTGAVALAQELEGEPLERVDVLLSHYHYDHIEGFPFLGTLFTPARQSTLHARECQGAEPHSLLAQYMQKPFFPVPATIYEGVLDYHTIREGERFSLGGFQVDTLRLHHPDTSTAFRLTDGKTVLVHLLDNEYREEQYEELAAFCKDAQLVVWDAYFTEKELEEGSYTGWGHSSYEQGVRFAQAAGVERLALTHHALWRTDAELEAMEARYPRAFVARDGLELEL